MKKVLYVVALILFFTNLLLSCVLTVSFSVSYYDKQYKNLEVYETIGISEEALETVTHQLLNYIKGKEDVLDTVVTIDGNSVMMFNEKEITHMEDVRDLYSNVVLFRAVTTIFIAVMLLVSLGSGDYKDLKLDTNLYAKALNIFTGALGFVGLYALIDFRSFWILFHKLIFTNDLWLLNPATDRMILMFPEPFFMGIVFRVIVIVSIIILFGYFVLFMMRRAFNHVTRSTI